MGFLGKIFLWISLVLSVFFFLLGRHVTAAADLHLTWVDNSDNENGFHIERSTGPDGTFVWIASVDVDVTSYPEIALEPGTLYCYRVRAFNWVGTSEYSNTQCATTTTLVATVESYTDSPSVSGITLVRGWAFDIIPEGQINSIELFIDGVPSGSLLCCSARGDVQAAFPQFPAHNTAYSGWGTLLNWGLLSAGMHTAHFEIRSTSGNVLKTQARTIFVVKPGNFEFLSRFDLSRAVAFIEEDELVVTGVVVQDSATLQEKEIEARFQWFGSSQSMEMVEAFTVAEFASRQSRVSTLAAALSSWFAEISTTAEARAALGVLASIESPQDGQAVSGVGLVRGWAFPEDPTVSLAELQLFLDGQLLGTVPCCSQRGDVASVFPSYPGALNSGWGVALNFGLLPAGWHTIGISMRDSTGAVHAIDRGVQVIRPGEFEFLDRFDIVGATASIEGEDIVIQGVWVRDQASQQEKVIDVRLRWVQNSQSLAIIVTTG